MGEIVYSEDKDNVWNAVETHRKDKAPLKLTYRIVTRAGDIKWIKDEAIPVLDQDKKIIRIDGFIEDVTELKSNVTVDMVNEAFRIASMG